MKLIKQIYNRLKHYLNLIRDRIFLLTRSTISVSSDSYNTDGLGALLQWQLWAYSLSLLYNKSYFFNGFKNIAHYQFEGLTSEKYDEKVNAFFDLQTHSENEPGYSLKIYEESKSEIPDAEIIKNRRTIQRTFDSKIIAIFQERYLIEIGEGLDKSTLIRRRDNINVGIHLRMFNKNDTVFDDIESFKLFDRDQKSVFRLNNIISHIEKAYPNRDVDFYLLIQYDSKKLNELVISRERNNLYKIIGVDVLETISTLVEVDILVGANSSLSYICHLLSGKKAYFSNEFRYNLYPNSNYFDEDGNIINLS